jgi:hypothetical protein
MRVLLDTNVLIHREASTVVRTGPHHLRAVPRQGGGRSDGGEAPLRMRGLEPPHPFGYMHLKHGAFANSATTANSKLVATTSSNAYLKLI